MPPIEWIVSGVAAAVIAFFLWAMRAKAGQRRERIQALKRAKEELKRAAKTVVEHKKAQVIAERKATEASKRREEVERAVDADREAAGRGTDPVGDLRARIRRLQGLPPEGSDPGDGGGSGDPGPK